MQATVVRAIAGAVASVADTLRTASVAEIGTSNALGDKQLVADVAADRWQAMAALWCCVMPPPPPPAAAP